MELEETHHHRVRARNHERAEPRGPCALESTGSIASMEASTVLAVPSHTADEERLPGRQDDRPVTARAPGWSVPSGTVKSPDARVVDLEAVQRPSLPPMEAEPPRDDGTSCSTP